jgi:multicomponent Na+:H+ antiporter subunit F
MITNLLYALLVALLALTLPFLWRVVAGPTPYDRIVGLNAIGTLVPAMLVLIGLIFGRVDMFVDSALALFLLNLFTTLIVARHTSRRFLSEDPE